jgi:hypothetical protein
VKRIYQKGEERIKHRDGKNIRRVENWVGGSGDRPELFEDVFQYHVLDKRGCDVESVRERKDD